MATQTDDGSTSREVNSLRKLASTNFTKFAVQVQHVSAEVQMKIIEQLPEFKKLATEAIEKLGNAHETTMHSIEHSEDHVHQGAKEWRDALIAMLDDPSLTLEEKLRITAQIGETVRIQKEVHAENNKAKAALFAKTALSVVGVVGIIVVAITGGKFGMDQGEDA